MGSFSIARPMAARTPSGASTRTSRGGAADRSGNSLAPSGNVVRPAASDTSTADSPPRASTTVAVPRLCAGSYAALPGDASPYHVALVHAVHLAAPQEVAADQGAAHHDEHARRVALGGVEEQAGGGPVDLGPLRGEARQHPLAHPLADGLPGHGLASRFFEARPAGRRSARLR